MNALKYTIIKSRQQYNDYCKELEQLLDSNDDNNDKVDEIELLTLLIEKWDAEHSMLLEVDPVELIH
jgi:HTH-type transcriptional regulator/antitoxin HigA